MTRNSLSRARLAAAAATLSLGVSAFAHADASLLNPIGLYVGGEVGAARTEAAVPGDLGGGEYSDNHAAYQFMVGVHPLLLPVGAELAYVDLGDLNDGGHNYYNGSTELKLHGPALFGTVHLPIPFVDVYLKAGAAHLSGTLEGYSPYAGGPIHTDYSGTHFAGGVGAAYSLFGNLGLRVEYQLFNAAGETQNMLAAGVTWTF